MVSSHHAGNDAANPYSTLCRYTQYLAPLAARGVQIGAPSIAGDLNWLSQFMSGCASTPGCPMPNFIPLHVYQNDHVAFENYITTVANMYKGTPIWVTEFGQFYLRSLGFDRCVAHLLCFLA